MAISDVDGDNYVDSDNMDARRGLLTLSTPNYDPIS